MDDVVLVGKKGGYDKRIKVILNIKIIQIHFY